MGSGSSSPSGGSSSRSRHTAGRSNPPVTFVVNEEKQGGPESEVAALIQVKSVSFLIAENCPDHNTDEYVITQDATAPKLVVRRGQFFKIQVELDRPYDKAKDKMSLEFDIGKSPTQTKRSLIKVDLDGKEEKNKWNAKIESSEGTKLVIGVRPAPDCIVGRWGFHIRVSNKNSRDENTPYAFKIYKEEHKIYILFNPWCKEDTVYLGDEGLRKEYILNDTGTIYYGSKRSIKPRSWSFGQFNDVILDCVLDLLYESGMDIKACSSSIQVARKLTALVNSNQDNGVLVGKWSGAYEGGTSPTKWAGSVAILEQYYSTKTSVKYGQCWVFSGVLTTCCRSLGIPARSVTNFASAHDTDSSVSIDKHFDRHGKALNKYNRDSVWNYHVWNDVWMSRPDIRGDYGGWQACDATPQEKSDGVHCCGPFPLKALKTGDVNLPYDGAFIFAEMNADRVNWILNEDDQFEVLKVIPNSIGFYISTLLPKCKGSSKDKGPCSHRYWEDVTSEYKHKEGSDEEKAALNNANTYSTMPGLIYGRTDDGPQDVKFELKQEEIIVYGQTYEMELVIENRCEESREVKVNVSLESQTTAGIDGSSIRDEYQVIVLPGKETKSFKMSVPFEEYDKKTLQFCNFKLQCNCEVMETKQMFIEDDSFCMDKPDLEVKGPEKCTAGDTITTEVTFVNPLPISLTKCELTVEGGMQKPRTVPLSESVEPNATFKKSFPFTFTKAGKRTIIAVFNSKELEDISGSVEIEVEPQ